MPKFKVRVVHESVNEYDCTAKELEESIKADPYIFMDMANTEMTVEVIGVEE